MSLFKQVLIFLIGFIFFFSNLIYSICTKQNKKLICFEGYFEKNIIKFSDLNNIYVTSNDRLVSKKIDVSNIYNKKYFKKWTHYSLNKKEILAVELKYFKNNDLDAEIHFAAITSEYLQLREITWYNSKIILQKNLYFQDYDKNIYSHKIFTYNQLGVLISTLEIFHNKKNHHIINRKSVFFFITNNDDFFFRED